MSAPIPWDPQQAKALSDFHRRHGGNRETPEAGKGARAVQPLTPEQERDIRSLDLLAMMPDRAAVVVSGHLAALLAELDRTRIELAQTRTQFADAAATVAEQVQRYGRRQRGHNADREELDHLRDRVAELEARPSRAEVLRQAAVEIEGIDAHPNATGSHLDLYRALGRRFRRLADAAEAGEGRG